MLLQLRPGMTKSQVRFIMGTPLVQDSFHGNRWDYVYQMHENGKLIEQRRVILDFEKELLKSVRGDVVPAGSEQAKAPEEAAPKGTRVVPPVKAEKEKSLLDKLKFWADDEPKAESLEAAKQQIQKNAEPVLPVVAAPASQAKQDVKQELGQALERETVQPDAGQAPSMLAVPIAVPEVDGAAQVVAAPPIEIAPLAPAPESAQLPKETAPASAPAPVVSEPAVLAPIVPLAEPVVEMPVTPAAEPVKPVNPYHYQSPAGMQFDRRLQIEEEELPPVVEPSGSRTGNKVAPQPKPLPPETEPSFFDRMLEQIGF